MADCHFLCECEQSIHEQPRGLDLKCQGQDLVIQGQGQDLHEVSSRIFEAKAGLEDNKTASTLLHCIFGLYGAIQMLLLLQ